MSTKHILAGVVVLGVVAGGAFYGGLRYGQRSDTTVSAVGRSFAGGGNVSGRQQNGGSQRGGSFGNRGDFVNGEIISRDGESVTVKTMDGGTKTIYFSSVTTVGKETDGTQDDLVTGQRVMASGKTNPDGSITADNIQIRRRQP